jgi:hypothetical protein
LRKVPFELRGACRAESFAQTNFHSEVTTMNLRRVAALSALLLLGGVAFHQARSADPPENKPTAPAVADKDFAVRYARAHLRVAELTLQKAREMNRQVAETLSKGIVEQFASDVEFAKAQLAEAERTGTSDAYALWLRRAELDARARKDRLQSATEANRRVPGAYPPIDLERMRAAAELANLRVERGKALANATPEARLAWQLEMINEGLNRVDEMVSLSLQNRLAEFF